MELSDLRLDIKDNVNRPSGEGLRVSDLVAFLSKLPQQALVVWSGEKHGGDLILSCPTPLQTTLYICESTHSDEPTKEEWEAHEREEEASQYWHDKWADETFG